MKTEKEKDQACFAENKQINRLLNRLVSDVREFAENQIKKIKRLTEIGVALSAEKRIDRLLEMIVDEARKFTNADGGTLYIMTDDEKELRFAIVQNDSLNVRMGGTSGAIQWSPVRLTDDEGKPNYANVSAYAAISGEIINIPDVYDAEGFNFEGTRNFDVTTGYRSQSMLVVPMRNHEQDIIGVLQLLNALDHDTGDVIPFSGESQNITESLASQAAVALTNNRLILDLQELLESFITSIATAIDEKSPYTGGHVRRVAELTIDIARRISDTNDGPYAGVSFNDDQMRELRIAAWLHDVGKITTPEYVVDKSTKLETICDRIELVRTRFEILRRERDMELFAKGLCGVTDRREGPGSYDETLEDDLDFLTNANMGSEFMSDDKIERLEKIGSRKWCFQGEETPILTADEMSNLCIRRGTLNDAEREIINNHALVTHKMLSQLPFPKKLRHVPEYAATHHEKLDGSGYPFGMTEEQLPLQSRILALADVFEALTAKDRPYKKGKTLSEALKIMKFMAKDKHIDPLLYDFFIKEGLHIEYARKELSPQQIDIDI